MNTQTEREKFETWAGRLLDLTATTDVWGRFKYAHEHVDSIWYGWQARTSLAQGDAAAPAVTDFDEWQRNPYTKVLQDSIANDYEPKHAPAAHEAQVDAQAEQKHALINKMFNALKIVSALPAFEPEEGYGIVVLNAIAAAIASKGEKG